MEQKYRQYDDGYKITLCVTSACLFVLRNSHRWPIPIELGGKHWSFCCYHKKYGRCVLSYFRVFVGLIFVSCQMKRRVGSVVPAFFIDRCFFSINKRELDWSAKIKISGDTLLSFAIVLCVLHFLGIIKNCYGILNISTRILFIFFFQTETPVFYTIWREKYTMIECLFPSYKASINQG